MDNKQYPVSLLYSRNAGHGFRPVEKSTVAKKPFFPTLPPHQQKHWYCKKHLTLKMLFQSFHLLTTCPIAQADPSACMIRRDLPLPEPVFQKTFSGFINPQALSAGRPLHTSDAANYKKRMWLRRRSCAWINCLKTFLNGYQDCIGAINNVKCITLKCFFLMFYNFYNFLY